MTKKFFIIAGEASGDALGAKVIREIKKNLTLINKDFKFIGVGGKSMQEEGLFSIFDMSELSIMGFVEVIPHLKNLLKRINQTAAEIIKQEPDVIITIDSPDFNFRVLKKIQDYKFSKKIHIIAPSVWAYRQNRAKKIAKLYDLLLAILPFEPPYFTRYGLKTVFIGHPIIEDAPNFSEKDIISKNFRNKYGFYQNDKIIYITPGSRISEIKRIYPEFINAINIIKSKIENISVIIASLDKTRKIVEDLSKDLEVKYIIINNVEKHQALMSSDFALAKSGTNTIEASLYRLPMIVAYKINFLTYNIVKFMIKVKFANLINIIMQRQIIPELIQNNCNSEKISQEMELILKNKNIQDAQISQSLYALRSMGLGQEESPSRKAAYEILKLCS